MKGLQLAKHWIGKSEPTIKVDREKSRKLNIDANYCTGLINNLSPKKAKAR